MLLEEEEDFRRTVGDPEVTVLIYILACLLDMTEVEVDKESPNTAWLQLIINQHWFDYNLVGSMYLHRDVGRHGY